MAKNSVEGPTNRAARYCFSTVTGTANSGEPAVARTSPEIPDPPIPQTAMLVNPLPDKGSRSTEAAAARASPNCSGSEATAPAKSRLSTTPVTG